MGKEEFVARARQVHRDKYDYSKVEYIGFDIKVCIICPKHGEFWQSPNNHLHGKGCRECAKELAKIRNILSTEQFVEKARKIHGDRYDYSKVEYKNTKTKVCIICPTHGEFWQSPNSHLRKHGCPKCKIDGIIKRQTMSNQTFIERSKKIHGDKYDYSKVDYKSCYDKVCVICPKHGEFWQIPCYHLSGNGCPKCNQSQLEKEIERYLIELNINFEQSKHFKWLGFQHLDFYLPEYKIAIECQGEQHFEPIKHFGGENKYKLQQERDKRKKQLCKENGIDLLYYTTYKNVKEDEITFKNKEKILDFIYKHETTP